MHEKTKNTLKKKAKKVRKRVKKRVHNVAKSTKKARELTKKASRFLFLYFLAKIFYIAGLTGIIPFIVFVTFPSEVKNYTGLSLSVLLISLFFLSIGIIAMYRLRDKNPGRLCKGLGKLTLIPGIVALLLFLFSKNNIIDALDMLIPQMQSSEYLDMLFSLYIQRVVPSLGFMTFAYLVIGLVLYWYGQRREKGKTFSPN